jgi:CDGSH-type Zn-finger protein/truncated hemoglobin YjbI/ferredoxin
MPDPQNAPGSYAAVASILSRASELERALVLAHTGQKDVESERLEMAARRLKASVLRPLREALARLPPSPAPPDGSPTQSTPPGDGDSDTSLGRRLRELAKAATVLRTVSGVPTQVQEATAALQDLACRFAVGDGDDGPLRVLTELRELQARLPRELQTQTNGPYLATNVEDLRTWLGEPIASRPQMALCRCGASATKPFCDGTHADIQFTDAKDSGRVPDHQDAYVGHQLTVLDNRGTCAHSGFCTDHLASVFHVGKDPFVTPSGGRMDEIIQAVRACPSGALSYAIDGREARDQVDQDRSPAIEVSRDGPYRVTGAIPLRNDDGHLESRGQGGSLEHYSLCRCGRSQNKPFCSGMHWTVQFKDPQPPAERDPTLFEWVGGFPALTRMTRVFYSKYVPQDPLLSPLFASMSSDHPERVAAWLGETFGGPKVYTERYGGYERMVSQHIGKALTEAQRSRWAQLMYQSADDAGLPPDPEFRAAFAGYIEWGSRIALENSQPGAKPPAHMPVPRWWWVCNATPAARISALAPEVENAAPVALPSPGEAVSFAKHIKPLFRKMDRDSMKFAFDMWSPHDVAQHAAAILQRLEAGTMPCDGAWPKEKVAVFRRWVESGTPE